MPCDVRSRALGAYVDGELSLEEMTAVRNHIAECNECGGELADLVSLKRGLRGLQNHFTPSMEFRSRVRASIAPKRSWWRLNNAVPYLAAAAAMAMLLFVLMNAMVRSRRADSLAEVADLHVAALASAHPLDVVSSDHHTVKPWFQGKIPFTFNIPDLAGTDFNLLGGRVMYFKGQPGAQLIVTYRKHEISVLIMPAQARASALPQADTLFKKDGFNIESWQEQGLLFVMISDVDKEKLRQLGTAVQKAN